MDLRFLLFLFAIIHFISLTLAAPRPPSIPIPGASENEIEENVVEGVADDKKVDGEIDELVFILFIFIYFLFNFNFVLFI